MGYTYGSQGAYIPHCNVQASYDVTPTVEDMVKKLVVGLAFKSGDWKSIILLMVNTCLKPQQWK